MGFRVHEASVADSAVIVQLVHELARSGGDVSPLDEQYVSAYLGFPGCHVVLADENYTIVGMASYSVRPNLYHGAASLVIEQMVVNSSARGRGAGGALVAAVLEQAKRLGCAEISVSTSTDNYTALRLYRGHGLIEQSVLLEKHLIRAPGENGAADDR